MSTYLAQVFGGIWEGDRLRTGATEPLCFVLEFSAQLSESFCECRVQ